MGSADNTTRPRWPALLLSVAATACVGEIGDPRSNSPPPDDTLPPPSTNLRVPCDPAEYAGVTLDAVMATYATHVHPALLDPAEGCLGCHGAGSGRQFLVGQDATETFHQLHALGFLDPGAGSIVARLEASSPDVRMPRGLPEWSIEKINRVDQVACALGAVTETMETPPDEQFPPGLLGEYTGPPPTDTYDNTFINYPQLRGKVQVVFGEAWVRDGVDRFEENLALFGGVDFMTYFQESRAATPDFLLALDGLGKEVCGQAARAATGPFAGFDPRVPLLDQPPSERAALQAESSIFRSSAGRVDGAGFTLSRTGALLTVSPHRFPGAGRYRVTVRARGTPADGLGPDMDLILDTRVRETFANVGTTLGDHVWTGTIAAGALSVGVSFTNDRVDDGGNDRNLFIDSIVIEGPEGGGTGDTREVASRTHIEALYDAMLFRRTSAEETDAARALLVDLTALGLPAEDAWSGLCEALVHHPDFLFTLPPGREQAIALDRDRLLLVKIAQDLVARPPHPSELLALAQGTKTVDQLTDDYLASTEFRDYFFYRMRIRTESDGTTEADEPARLWTYLFTRGEPFARLLDGDFGVDENFARVARPAEHGRTGVLTMPGYIKHKPGLPHFNYSARVFSDFMGRVFEVPQEVIDARLEASAATTVDPTSICYGCHKDLTPLAYQRLAWSDEGEFRTVDEYGAAIDDSDRGLVPEYKYKGAGMEAFSTRAVNKEAFIRQTLNAEYQLLLGRPMRHDTDERAVYAALWQTVKQTDGDLRATLKAIMASPAYRGR